MLLLVAATSEYGTMLADDVGSSCHLIENLFQTRAGLLLVQHNDAGWMNW
jgi:hypothetical protein